MPFQGRWKRRKKMIHLNNVTRTFSNLKAISQVDLVISQGDIIGVVGKNGAGKTTLLKMIAGNLQPSEGSILVNGEDIFIRGQKYKYNVGFSSGNTSGLYMKMSVWDNITFFASMFRVPRKVARNRAAELLRYFDLYEKRDSSIGSLSTGMKLKLKLAIAVIHTPTILILDEATSGMDYEAVQKTMELIRFLNKNCGTTVLFTTHKISEIDSIANKIIILDSGHVISKGLIEQYYSDYRSMVCIKAVANKKDEEYIVTALSQRKDIKLFEVEPGKEDHLLNIKIYTVINQRDIYELIRGYIPNVEVSAIWSEDLDLESMIKIICKGVESYEN